MDMGMGMMGLGLAGDIAGGIANWQTAQRQRDLYKKQLEIQQILRDPNQVLAGSSPYYQANLGALKTSMPDIIRQQVAPQLGMRGIDPTGGQGQLITQQAIAPFLMQAQQDAQSRYIQALTGGQQGLNYAGGNAGQGMGPMNNTAQAMRSLMMMQAMRANQGSHAQAPSGGSDPGRSGMMTQYGGGYDPAGVGASQSMGPQLDFGYNNFQFGQGYNPTLLTGAY